jgi:hypothetical protein
MVEIHEPVRLLMVVETTTVAVAAVLEREANVAQLVRNRWIRLVTYDRASDRIDEWVDDRTFHRFVPSGSSLPEVDASAGWYGGRRAHLPPARVRA